LIKIRHNKMPLPDILGGQQDSHRPPGSASWRACTFCAKGGALRKTLAALTYAAFGFASGFEPKRVEDSQDSVEFGPRLSV
jgi:hypothetical protein